MELIHIFFILIFNFLSVMPTSGKPDPVKNIKVTVTGNTTKVSWQTPTQTGSSRIYLKNSKTYLSLVLPRRDSKERNGLQMDLRAPVSSIMIKGLQMCSEYAVILLFNNGGWSVETEQKFWTTNELKPPQNVKINVIGNNATISWTIAKLQEVNTSVISLFDSKGRKVAINSSKNYKNIEFPVRSCVLVNLKLCSEYVVKIEYISRGVWSGATEQKFWMTSNIFTADINTNVVLSWTTTLVDFFSVYSPFNSTVIYGVNGGSFIVNTKTNKYRFDNSTENVSAINITVINVNKTDAGLYRAEGNNKVDGCCLLIVTSKPIDTTLSLQPEHPFVGDYITFTCSSKIQRWPEGYETPHLSYQFHGSTRGNTTNNRLKKQILTKSEKGTQIKCQATDDRGKVSNMSNTVTLDPYYGPDNVELAPVIPVINVTEGTNLGPINCTANCNPECKYQWKHNRTGQFERVQQNFMSNNNRILTIAKVNRSHTGVFRCRVDHKSAKQTKKLTTDLTVNVQYPPKFVRIDLSDQNTIIAKSGNPTTYTFNETVNVTMTLNIESNPDAQLHLNSSLLKIDRLNYTKKAQNYTSKLPSLKCENSGIFQIQASNGILNGETRTINLTIYCKPRNVTTRFSRIGTKVNKKEKLVLHVVSFPVPVVKWLPVTEFEWTVKKDRYDYKYEINSTIHIKTEKDFREYGIEICNKLGCILENITVIAEDSPEAPQNFSVATTTFRSVNLSWIAGFNGGHEQTFFVKYRARNNVKWYTEDVQTNDIRSGCTVYYTLDQLKSDTSYQIFVVSKNSQGERNASLEFKTEVEPTVKSPSKSASMTPIFIGIGCGIAVILMIVISVYMFFNKRNKGSTSGPSESNVLYAAVDKVQQKFKRRNTENEDTHMSNEPANAEYASVVKPKSKSKKVHYKEDEIETVNDEYAVVDKSNRKINFTEDDTTYANQGDADLLIRQPSRTKPSGRRKNKDGLTYIEVSFARKPKNKRVIIGAENRTNYVDIDFTRTADPLPETADE